MYNMTLKTITKNNFYGTILSLTPVNINCFLIVPITSKKCFIQTTFVTLPHFIFVKGRRNLNSHGSHLV
jgi:hypothetical protein